MMLHVPTVSAAQREAARLRAKFFPQAKRVAPAPEPTPEPPQHDQAVIDFEQEKLIRQAAQILKDSEWLDTLPRPPAAFIIRTVAEFYGLHKDEILGDRRNKNFVLPRHVAMFLVANLTALSFPQIAKIYFRGRDHTTVLSAFRKIGRLLQSDARLRDEMQLIVMRLAEDYDTVGWDRPAPSSKGRNWRRTP
jgi:hypothetical protein